MHGGTPQKKKAAYIDAFRDGVLDVLVGTASLATGTDGLDKVCDCLVILDDTDDDIPAPAADREDHAERCRRRTPARSTSIG